MPRKLPGDIDEEYVERRITLRVDSHLHEALAEVARSRGESMNELAWRILHQYLAAHDESHVLRSLERTGERHEENVAALRRTAVDQERRTPGWLYG